MEQARENNLNWAGKREPETQLHVPVRQEGGGNGWRHHHMCRTSRGSGTADGGHKKLELPPHRMNQAAIGGRLASEWAAHYGEGMQKGYPHSLTSHRSPPVFPLS